MENQFSISRISQFKVLSKHLQYINKTHKCSTSCSGSWPVEVACLYQKKSDAKLFSGTTNGFIRNLSSHTGKQGAPWRNHANWPHNAAFLNAVTYSVSRRVGFWTVLFLAVSQCGSLLWAVFCYSLQFPKNACQHFRGSLPIRKEFECILNEQIWI